MAFLGILANPDYGIYAKNTLRNDFSSQHDQIIFINKNNIDNVKHIRFETILFDSEEKIDSRSFMNILQHTKNLIVNSDIPDSIKLIQNLDLQVITFGFNQKATVTISSITDESILMCIQRSIQSCNGKIIEPQELRINIKKQRNIMPNTIIGAQILRVLYHKI